MQAVVIATEKDQIMGPLTDSSSVHGLPIGNVSMIEGIVSQLESIGVDHITVNIENSAVKGLLGAERGVDRIEDEDKSIRFSGPRDDMTEGLDETEPFLCVRSDMFYETEELEELAEADTGIGYVRESSDLKEYTQGNVTVEGGSVNDIEAGKYALSGEFSAYAFKFPADAHEWNYGVDPMATELAHTHAPTAVEFAGWYPVQTPHQLLAVQSEGVSVHPNADVEGTVLGSSYIGPDVTVEENAVVKDSIICEGSTIRHGAFVGSSVVGTWVDVDENVTVEHRSTDDRTVTYNIERESIDSGRSSFGTVVGSRVRITAGSVISRGRVLDAGIVVG